MTSKRSTLAKGVPLYWASLNMRAGMVVVSPIITLIGQDLGLSSTQLALLISIPVLCFAFASPLTTWIRHYGSLNQVITWALWVLTIGLTFRAIGPASSLFGFTILVGLGIAALNVLLPIWVKENAKEQSGLLTGLYVSMMGIATTVAIGLAVPLANATNLGWRLALLPWGVVAAISAIWWQVRMKDQGSNSVLPADINIRTFLHSRLAWQITLVFGCQSMTAYSSRAWLPTIMSDKGFSMAAAGLTVALTGLVGSLLAIGIPHWAQRSKDQRKAIWIISLTTLVALVGIEFSSGVWLVLWVLAVSVGQWSAYPLALLLIILRSPNPDEGQSLSAMVQSFGYLMGASAPLITGALFDLTLNWSCALTFLIVMTVIQALAGHAAGRITTVQKRVSNAA